jgi:hypothetical protein
MTQHVTKVTSQAWPVPGCSSKLQPTLIFWRGRRRSLDGQHHTTLPGRNSPAAPPQPAEAFRALSGRKDVVRRTYPYHYCLERRSKTRKTPLSCSSLTRPPRHRHLPGQGPDYFEHQRLLSGSGHDQVDSRSIWRRLINGGCQRQADHHQRWSHRHEGAHPNN